MKKKIPAKIREGIKKVILKWTESTSLDMFCLPIISSDITLVTEDQHQFRAN